MHIDIICHILHFHLQHRVTAQNQLFSGFAPTARCPLPPAAVWSSFSRAQCCQTLWSWLHYQMSPEWNGLFYHLTQWQLSARHPHTCKGRYMALLCISPSKDRRRFALQRHWRGNQKYPLRYGGFKEWWKNARSALYSLSLIVRRRQS